MFFLILFILFFSSLKIKKIVSELSQDKIIGPSLFEETVAKLAKSQLQNADVEVVIANSINGGDIKKAIGDQIKPFKLYLDQEIKKFEEQVNLILKYFMLTFFLKLSFIMMTF